jgi:hypothetical protein
MVTEQEYLRYLGALAEKIEEHESVLVDLRAHREKTIQALVELRASRTPIMEA